MQDLEERVRELEAAVIWLAETVHTGQINATAPELLQPVFKRSCRPDEAKRREKN